MKFLAKPLKQPNPYAINFVCNYYKNLHYLKMPDCTVSFIVFIVDLFLEKCTY